MSPTLPSPPLCPYPDLLVEYPNLTNVNSPLIRYRMLSTHPNAPSIVPAVSSPCGDNRALNYVTIPDRYPLPHIHDCVSSLHGMKVLSTIDIVRAFHQTPVAPEGVSKTDIATPRASFGFLRMTFGLQNATQTFQRFIDWVLRGLGFCCAYVDDILIASKNEEKHLQLLGDVFQAARR